MYTIFSLYNFETAINKALKVFHISFKINMNKAEAMSFQTSTNNVWPFLRFLLVFFKLIGQGHLEVKVKADCVMKSN